jgi:hypothetical protein
MHQTNLNNFNDGIFKPDNSLKKNSNFEYDIDKNLNKPVNSIHQTQLVDYSNAIPLPDEAFEIQRIAKKVSPDNLQIHLSKLSSLRTEGRGVGEKGIETAKEYISEKFQEYGLEPVKRGLKLDSYYEEFIMPKYPVKTEKRNEYYRGYLDRYHRPLEKAKTSNVLGMIKGTEKPDEYIVISAHYDHLGKDKKNNIIYPGANDDASGVVTMMEIARILSKEKPKKSVIFAALSGEESGLLGAEKLSNDLKAKGIAKNVQVLNLEMLGAMKGNVLDIWDQNIDKAKNMVNNLVKVANVFGVKTNLISHEPPPTDSREFNRNGIPAITAIWDSKLSQLFKNHPTLHTSQDTIENINKKSLHDAAKVLAATSYLLVNDSSNDKLSFTSNNNKLLELDAYKQKALNII